MTPCASMSSLKLSPASSRRTCNSRSCRAAGYPIIPASATGAKSDSTQTDTAAINTRRAHTGIVFSHQRGSVGARSQPPNPPCQGGFAFSGFPPDKGGKGGSIPLQQAPCVTSLNKSARQRRRRSGDQRDQRWRLERPARRVQILSHSGAASSSRLSFSSRKARRCATSRLLPSASNSCW